MAVVKNRVGFHSAFLLSIAAITAAAAAAPPDYADALSKCIMFYEGQRSGMLPPSQRLTWRKDSALKDGEDLGVDLTGGYYDAGDNVKFGFPMAYTATMLAWSIIEFAAEMGCELDNARSALKWNTDYLLKATALLSDYRLFVQVGDPFSDHNCWQRPEDMDTLRTTYEVNATHPGSEVAGETAAALAAASIVFAKSRPDYAYKLLTRAKAVFDFAETFQGSYSTSVGRAVCPFYCDYGGFHDELVWAAAWLNRATNSTVFLPNIIRGIQMIKKLEEEKYDTQFSWENKHAGFYTVLLETHQNAASRYREAAEAFVCSVLPESPLRTVIYTPGGLMFSTTGCNMQNVVGYSFLLLLYARYLASVDGTVKCGGGGGGESIQPSRLIQVAKSQVDYILGDNPFNMSYMVGYGTKFPQKIHHRGSTVPSVDQQPQHLACRDGDSYFASDNSNPNLLIGAVVGGPNDGSDKFNDTRNLPAQTEPTTYVNAPLVGLLAYFSKNG